MKLEDEKLEEVAGGTGETSAAEVAKNAENLEEPDTTDPNRIIGGPTL